MAQSASSASRNSSWRRHDASTPAACWGNLEYVVPTEGGVRTDARTSPAVAQEFLFDSEPEEPPAAAAAATVAPSQRTHRQERLEAKVVAQALQLSALTDTVKRLLAEIAKLKGAPAIASQQAVAGQQATISGPGQ